MDTAPGVLDLEVAGGPGGQDSHVRGVALAGNGLLLTLADRIPTGAQIVSAMFEGRPITCQGWLARDPVNNWLIVKTTLAVPTRPAQLVAAQYLKFGPHELLAIPVVDGATIPVHGRTVKPTAGPDGAPPDPNAPLFWITGPSDLLVPGSPVYNRHGHLVGLIDQVRLDKALAEVRKVIAPLPVFDAAVDQEDGIPISQSAPSGFNLEPFKDPAIAPEVSQSITQGLSGEALGKTCDQLLLQHGDSAHAWYLASLGYARAGQDDRALSSAQMLTQIAPKAWQSWYLYARQQEGAKQFGAALDAYQNATEHNGPIRLLGLPIATCLFKTGDISAGLDYCKNLTNLDDRLFAAWVLQGDAQRAQNLLPDAVKSYTQAVELNPQSVRAWEALAAVCDQLHSATGSIESYIQLTLLVPDEPDIWYNLGLAFLRVHKLDAAQKSFEKVVELRPEDHVAQEQLIRVAEIEKTVPDSVR
jgi:tetratricopeptide (TPR) repeat protein